MKIAVIPAKGKSKRLANKNMRIINNKPMINYSISYAERSTMLDDIYISTDSQLIASHVKKLGHKVIMRPVTLGGEIPIIEVYKHALASISNSIDIEFLYGLQPDHPDRKIECDKVINFFISNEADRLFSKDKLGEKNGAHYIISKYFFDNMQSRKDIFIIDNCTNVHYEKDIEAATQNLKKKND